MTNYSRKKYTHLRHWAALFRPCLCLAVASLAMTACDYDTMNFGNTDIVVNEDQIVTGTATFQAVSHSDTLGAVRANSRTCHLGQIQDPVTGIVMKAEYACQLHCYEGSNFPAIGNLAELTDDGKAKCDSVELIIYYNSWYGDGNAPLKVSVLPLDRQHVLENDTVFYTDVNLQNYIASPAKPIGSKVVTAWDNTLSYTELTDIYHTHCARIRLPNSVGDDIMRKYFESPWMFTSTYRFLHNVCAGYYLRLDGGEDAMLTVTSTSLNIYYRYKTDSGVENAYTNFVGTAEVVQATCFEAQNLKPLVERDSCTYVSSPAGLYTEVQLPIDKMYAGHETDSLARVQMTVMRYNSNGDAQYSSERVFGAPSMLAMIAKSELKNFFEKGYVLESRKFATANFSAQYNCYDFSNISRLIAYMRDLKASGAADYDKVVLVPVAISTNTTAGTVVTVSHDMNVSAARLVGGPKLNDDGTVKHPINIHVTYSRYK